MTLAKRHQAFHDLHQSGCFVIPNPWDRGSARMMAALGAQALATSSAAHAFTLGRPDLGGVTRDEALAHAQDLIAATNLPVSGDFENGFGDTTLTTTVQSGSVTPSEDGELVVAGCAFYVNDTGTISING
ncbi:MAG: isocitrate lyase/phosphoenolpyruvate mutase family protein, partial [Pseudomonadota bacterium]